MSLVSEPAQSRFRLSAFLRAEVESILTTWEGQARAASGSASELRSIQLRDGLPEILNAIASHAKNPDSTRSSVCLSPEAARTHAEHRWNWGFSLQEVTREYGLLRNVIIEKLSQNLTALTGEELMYLFGAVDGAIVESVVSYAEISRRTLTAERRRLQLTLGNIGDGILCTDVEGRINYLNPAAETILGCLQNDVLGKLVGDILVMVDETSGRPVRSMSYMTLKTHQQEAHPSEIVLLRNDGERVTLEEIVVPLLDADEHFFGVVVTLRDVSKVRGLNEQLAHMATHDALTGLPNRALLKDRLAQELAHAERHGGWVGLMYLDLDLFKEVNDMLGHPAGDELLRQVAGRLEDCVRRTDTVCRVGGDEFIILVGEFDAMESLHELGAKIAASLTAEFQLDSDAVAISTSVGISVFPEDGEDPETLIKHADTAMYQAKAYGRNNVQFFAPEMNRRIRERRELQEDLRHSLADNQLSLTFQPQICLGTGKVVGAEVLLRWQHPKLGEIEPKRFIPAAEENWDVMQYIGGWVLEEACRQARDWLDAGHPALRLSVNLSIVQLRSDDLVTHIESLLERFRLSADMLQLELTESVLMSDLAGAKDRVSAIEKMGVRIAVDGFGIGCSSLSYIKGLPVDELKIDKSFVHDISSDPDKAAIVNAVIGMGQSLNLRVIAEGVEDKDAMSYLLANGCDVGQGFYFSKPLAPAEFSAQFLSAGCVSE
ncbi:MAG: putative bifunctional diguanylate cyclase/phosphodiesterase [Marinobacter sp.]